MAGNWSKGSGSSTMLILKLLTEKDMYGYEMIETLGERSSHVFDLKVGTLYPLLHGLVQEEYLETYSEEVNGKLRKYYHITEKGKKHLARIIKEWQTYAGAVYELIGG